MAIDSLLGLPFVVESIAPQRIQLWANFASQYPTQQGFNVVSTAFYALWFEVGAAREYQEYTREVQEGWKSYLVYSLDGLLASLLYMQQYWSEAIERLQQIGEAIPTSPYYRDAWGQVSFITQCVQHLVPLLASLCEQCNKPFPTALTKYMAEQELQSNE